MLHLCWSNTKRFLSVLVVFGKSFVFAKMLKKFQKICFALFWRLSHGLIQSHAPVASPHRNFSRLTGESMSWLQNLSFYHFSRLSLATCLRVEVPVVRVLRDFHDLPCNSLVGRTSSREKYLEKIFQIFSLKYLAAYPGDSLAT